MAVVEDTLGHCHHQQSPLSYVSGIQSAQRRKTFEASLIELMPCLLLVTHQSVCITEPVLKQLEVILGKLMVQITE
jgi:hypothetical protein